MEVFADKIVVAKTFLLESVTSNFSQSSFVCLFLVVEGLILVLVYGILFYPFFACLATDHRLIGAVLGFIYGAIRLDNLKHKRCTCARFSFDVTISKEKIRLD